MLVFFFFYVSLLFLCLFVLGLLLRSCCFRSFLLVFRFVGVVLVQINFTVVFEEKEAVIACASATIIDWSPLM